MTLTNPHDCLQIELFLDENDTTSFNRKQRELQRRGMYESSLRSCLVPELVSSDVWTFLRVKHEIEERDTRGVRVALYEHLIAKQKRYETTIEEDFSILSGNSDQDVFPSNRQARTAIQFRFEEKKLLRDVLSWLKSEIGEFGDREEF